MDPDGFGEHYTHHRVPRILYYWLQTATKTLKTDDASFLPRHGYFSVLATIVTGRTTNDRNDGASP
jgi:hypothetical protein